MLTRLVSAFTVAAALLLPASFFLHSAAAGAPQAKDAPPASSASAARAQVRFEMRLTRTDSGSNTPVSLGTPIITTLDGSTASVSITGGEPSFMVSLSPTLEQAKSDNSGQQQRTVAVLWNMRLSGKGLPGVTAAAVNGASRVPLARETLLAELLLKDPASGKSSRFQLFVTTSVTDAPSPEGGSGASAGR